MGHGFAALVGSRDPAPGEAAAKKIGSGAHAPQLDVTDRASIAVLAVYQAMLPILREAPGARIVGVSSGLGSLMTSSDASFSYRAIFSPFYPASKTARNALTVAMAIELEPEGHQGERKMRNATGGGAC